MRIHVIILKISFVVVLVSWIIIFFVENYYDDEYRNERYFVSTIKDEYNSLIDSAKIKDDTHKDLALYIPPYLIEHYSFSPIESATYSDVKIKNFVYTFDCVHNGKQFYISLRSFYREGNNDKYYYVFDGRHGICDILSSLSVFEQELFGNSELVYRDSLRTYLCLFQSCFFWYQFYIYFFIIIIWLITYILEEFLRKRIKKGSRDSVKR